MRGHVSGGPDRGRRRGTRGPGPVTLRAAARKAVAPGLGCRPGAAPTRATMGASLRQVQGSAAALQFPAAFFSFATCAEQSRRPQVQVARLNFSLGVTAGEQPAGCDLEMRTPGMGSLAPGCPACAVTNPTQNPSITGKSVGSRACQECLEEDKECGGLFYSDLRSGRFDRRNSFFFFLNWLVSLPGLLFCANCLTRFSNAQTKRC